MNTENEFKLNVEPTATNEVFELETLIVSGTDNFLPLKFKYPNTDKVVGVFIRPVSTTEFANAINANGDIFTEILSVSLYDNNKNLIPKNIIERMPVGLCIELYKKVAEISGIPTDNDKEVSKEMVDKLMGF